MTVQIIIMAVCLLMSAYFSATETAFSTASKTKLKTLVEKDNKRAALALKLSENYDKLISTILIGNNLVNILLSSLATLVAVDVCTKLKSAEFAAAYSTLFSTAITTVVVLMFGEITPKSVAKNRPENFAMFSAPLMQFFIWILFPLGILFSGWTKLVAKIFRLDSDSKMSQEELLMLVEEVQEEGTIDDEEGDLLRNSITFTDQKVEDILTHRVDLEAFEMNTPIEEIGRLFEESRYSRLLVYEDTIDKIVGVVHQKDIFTTSGLTDRPLSELLTEPLYIHRTESIDDLLRTMQQNKAHMAVVLDEYGGTLGIVTMEDILEELVGEIWDEHDEVVEDIRFDGSDTWTVSGSADLYRLLDKLDIDEDAVESASVTGWVMEELGKVPVQGDSFVSDDWKITVTVTDERRVQEIRVEKLKAEGKRQN